jgi:hypothetical protein
MLVTAVHHLLMVFHPLAVVVEHLGVLQLEELEVLVEVL